MKGGMKKFGKGPQDYAKNLYNTDTYLNERIEEPKSKIDLKKEMQNLTESKELIERELRKLGITTQRREILRNKLQEIDEKLKDLKSQPTFLYN